MMERYTVHFNRDLIAAIVMPPVQSANRDGIAWHYSRPPVQEIEFEMDLRGVSTELRLV